MALKDVYKVGNKKPPKHAQFEKGQSGNPKGRPRRVQDLTIALGRDLLKRIRVNENGRPRRYPHVLVLQRLAVKDACDGDLDRLRNYFELAPELNRRILNYCTETRHQTPEEALDAARRKSREMLQIAIQNEEARCEGNEPSEQLEQLREMLAEVDKELRSFVPPTRRRAPKSIDLDRSMGALLNKKMPVRKDGHQRWVRAIDIIRNRAFVQGGKAGVRYLQTYLKLETYLDQCLKSYAQETRTLEDVREKAWEIFEYALKLNSERIYPWERRAKAAALTPETAGGTPPPPNETELSPGPDNQAQPLDAEPSASETPDRKPRKPRKKAGRPRAKRGPRKGR